MATTQIDRISFRDVKTMDDKEVRQTYTKWRDIAHKRASRARAKGLDGDITREFPKLRDLSINEARGWLVELNKYITDPGTTLKGYKARQRKQLATLHSGGGFKYINSSNLNSFGRFMERARSYAMDHRLPNSNLVANIYNEAQRLHISDKVLENKFKVFQASERDKHRLFEALQSTKETGRRTSAKKIVARMEELKDND